jgi:hypothetical protein
LGSSLSSRAAAARAGREHTLEKRNVFGREKVTNFLELTLQQSPTF